MSVESVSSPVTEFVESLAGLSRGELAALKRCVGNTISESLTVAGVFYHVLPPIKLNSYEEEIYFLVATLFGLNKYPGKGDFGNTMRLVKSASNGSKNIDRRFSILLDSEFDLVDGARPGGGELSYRLRQCVALAASKSVGVDWSILLEDLCWWNHLKKKARKKWARSYFGEIKEDNKSQEGGDQYVN